MEVDTNNIIEVLDYIDDKVKHYYNNYDLYESDVNKLIELNSKFASLSWFIAREVAFAEADFEGMKGEVYNTHCSDKTIAETNAIVKEKTKDKRLYYLRLYNAMKALTNLLTQASIRIKHLREEYKSI